MIVFLDIDGVLNSAIWHEQGQPGKLRVNGQNAPLIDPAAVALLDPLVSLGARFVLSSAWRAAYDGPEITGLLRKVGFRGEVFDRTKPDGLGGGLLNQGQTRGKQIYEWIVRNRYAGPFAIFDDDGGPDYWHPVFAHLVQTDFIVGLTRDHVVRAVAMLGATQPAA